MAFSPGWMLGLGFGLKCDLAKNNKYEEITAVTPPPGGFVSVVWEQTYRFRDLRKGLQVTLHKMCVTSLLCGPWADLWPFYRLYCKQFSLYLKFYQGWGLQRSGPTDSLKENGRKFAPTAPVASNFYRASFSWRAATRKW